MEATEERQPRLAAWPAALPEGDMLVAVGAGWPDCPLQIEIDGRPVRPHDILRGSPVGGEVRPDGYGRFSVQLATRGLGPGAHKLVMSGPRRAGDAVTTFEVIERPRPDPAGRVVEASYW